MKKWMYAAAIALGVATFYGCSNGQYSANTVTPANNSNNPLNPSDSASFNWTGQPGYLVADINGTHFSLDSTQARVYDDTGGGHIVSGILGGPYGLFLRLGKVWAGNKYNVTNLYYPPSDVNNTIIFYDTVNAHRLYTCYFGNVGQIYMVQNDALRFKGYFYCQTLDSVGGSVVNIANGWFDLPKY